MEYSFEGGSFTMKVLNIGTPSIVTLNVLKLDHIAFDFTMQ